MSSCIIILFLTLNFYVAFSSYELFKLSEQWPPSFCQTNGRPCNRLPVPSFPYFTIHGLWPTNKTARVEYCSRTAFDPKLLNATLTNQLKQQWPNLLPRSDATFWKHEWEKHGTCSENKFDLPNYFQLTINIKQRLDIHGILVAAGYGPTQNKQFNDTDLIRVIKAKTGFEPELYCQSVNIGTVRHIFLTEIVLCLNPDGVDYTSCPSTTNTAVALCKSNLFEFPVK